MRPMMRTSQLSVRHPPGGSAPRSVGTRQARLKSLAVAAVAILLLVTLLGGFSSSNGSQGHPPLPSGVAGGGGGYGGNAAAFDGSSGNWSHPLFSQVQRDLRPFNFSGIGLRQTEQAYCQGTRASMRVQVINGNVYIVGESPSYESRMLSLKRQLLQLWLDGGLPEGIDFVIEHEDRPTVRCQRSEDCPMRGPIIAPAKCPSNSSHNHVLLAPDHTFGGWLEAHTLSWAEMLPLLQHSANRHPWEERSGLLFLRGASTGERNLTDPDLNEAYPELLDVQMVNWTSVKERTYFVSLADHCCYRSLLHLPGNSYAGRLKYLLACGSAVVMPESPWHEFWYGLLHPAENIIVTDEVSLDNRGHQFADVAAELQQDDALAQRVGAAGAALVRESLSPAMVQAYWQLLLREYRSLQTYNATLHPDAVPLERSILVPELMNVTQRTCLLCKPTAEQLEEQRRADLGLMDEEDLRDDVEAAAALLAASMAFAQPSEAAGQPVETIVQPAEPMLPSYIRQGDTE